MNNNNYETTAAATIAFAFAYDLDECLAPLDAADAPFIIQEDTEDLGETTWDN